MTPSVHRQVLLGPDAVAEYRLRTLHRYGLRPLLRRDAGGYYRCQLGRDYFFSGSAAYAIQLAYEFVWCGDLPSLIPSDDRLE